MQEAIFDSEVEEARLAGLNSLKNEMKSVESLIDKFLTHLLECTSSLSERDFNVCGL